MLPLRWAQGMARLEQVVQWCGQAFDGLVLYDECHKVRPPLPPGDTSATVPRLQCTLRF